MARQNLLFTYFTCTLSAEIRAAKAEGRYFEGVSDLGGSYVSKVEPKVRHLANLPWHTVTFASTPYLELGLLNGLISIINCCKGNAAVLLSSLLAHQYS